MLENLAHIGYVVENIESSLKRFIREEAEVLITPTVDSIQKVRICLLKIKEGINIELISPVDYKNSPIQSRLNRGGGLDHICFYTNSISKSLSHEKRNGNIIICNAVWSNIFNNYIAFVHRRSGLIVEFLENKEKSF